METRPYILPHSLRDEFLGLGLSIVVLFAGDPAACEQVVAEVGGGVAAFLGYAVALEYLTEGGKYYPDVAQEGDFLDVLEVVADFSFPGDGVAPAYLRESAESLPHGVALALFRGHEDHVAHQQGPGPDYGHVALEDVEQFREFVEAGGTQELAVGVQPHVVGEQVALRVLLVGHGAELDEPEYLFALAGAGLREEGVALHLDGAHEGEDHQQRAEDGYGREGTQEVQGSFQEAGVHVYPYSKQARMAWMMGSCCSGVILLSLGRHRPRANMSAPLSWHSPAM